jgi:hypothetical protein
MIHSPMHDHDDDDDVEGRISYARSPAHNVVGVPPRRPVDQGPLGQPAAVD